MPGRYVFMGVIAKKAKLYPPTIQSSAWKSWIAMEQNGKTDVMEEMNWKKIKGKKKQTLD